MATGDAQRVTRSSGPRDELIPTSVLGKRTRAAVDEAIEAIWAFFSRPSPSGDHWEDIDGCETADDYRAALATDPGALVRVCRDLASYAVGMKPHELAAVRMIVDIADALAPAGQCPDFNGETAARTPGELRAIAVIIEIADALALAGEERGAG